MPGTRQRYARLEVLVAELRARVVLVVIVPAALLLVPGCAGCACRRLRRCCCERTIGLLPAAGHPPQDRRRVVLFSPHAREPAKIEVTRRLDRPSLATGRGTTRLGLPRGWGASAWSCGRASRAAPRVRRPGVYLTAPDRFRTASIREVPPVSTSDGSKLPLHDFELRQRNDGGSHGRASCG